MVGHQGLRCQARHFITGKIIIRVNFLIVEDVKTPIIGLDAIHHNRLQVHLHGKGKFILLHGKGKFILQQHQCKALLHYHQSHYYASGLVLPDHVQSHHLRCSDPQFTTLDNQSASNIIAEIDDKIISESRKFILEEESQEDLSQQAQVPHRLKVPQVCGCSLNQALSCQLPVCLGGAKAHGLANSASLRGQSE